MSRVDKVIISTAAVMANGGLIAHSGAYQLVMAAQEHSIPVIVVSAMYKLTPMYPFDSMKLNELYSPQTIMGMEEGDNMGNLSAVVPAYDYVPPEYISLYITNQGGFSPNYIYRQFSENYTKEDKLEDEEDM
uniref:Translation initiation factor eIF2B subunit beta n=1 Tax=Strombidium inclinatum TaxID=197538 RepID=A0A7S3IW96_9SPIT|mmetsp:Transcript_5680/g.9004  ORF Transcript_5680/g.9004 Transcript_5680/m.9004 type:complete len:132 (+) Transcript_5680:905-1300(+)